MKDWIVKADMPQAGLVSEGAPDWDIASYGTGKSVKRCTSCKNFNACTKTGKCLHSGKVKSS